jgi:uncharacterized protein (TIGR03083 family)
MLGGTTMEEKEHLIRQLDAARDELRAVLEDVDTQMTIYPGWTIKHVLAHITGWDDASTASLRAHASGEDAGAPASRGINYYNAESVATREALSYAHVVKECELAREELKTILEEMPPEKYRELMLFPWGDRGRIAELVTIFVEHEVEHAEEIRNLIESAG